MLLTVAVCTWNRCELLRQALEQMTHLVIPAEVDWELLVVNNNCTDNTDEVIAAFTSRLPIRRLFEPMPGKSNALNMAVREAMGQYVLWTDDDALVDPNWLAAYVRAFEEWPEAAFFGGPVQPWFAAPCPPWLERVWPRVAHTFATRDFGPHPLRFEGGNHLPYGVNWAVKSKAQRAHPYDPRLGIHSGRKIGCEETTVMMALLAEGYEGWWIPSASVRHYIPAERMNTRYLRTYFSGYGTYVAMKEASWHGPAWFGQPRWLWRQIVTAELLYRIRRLTSPPEIWINDLIAASMAWGALSVDRARQAPLPRRRSD